MKNDNNVGPISNFISFSIFSYLVHIPDTNFEESGNELTRAHLEMNNMVAAYKGTALQHNSVPCF